MACPPSSDRSFGPRVNLNCRTFDFTLQFEDIILGSIPEAIFLLFSIPQVVVLLRKKQSVTRKWGLLFAAKIVRSHVPLFTLKSLVSITTC
jgi:hypothetical protein